MGKSDVLVPVAKFRNFDWVDDLSLISTNVIMKLFEGVELLCFC
jgi:predicted Zn-dependent protease with MMP-like domain